MSAFERYDRTSRHYDATRRAVGCEIILGCLARHARPLGTLSVLDAGCGTGAYSEAIAEHVGRIVAIDLSAGMLGHARDKLARHVAAGRVALHRASIAALPLADASVDAVMINQVLHHLGDAGDDFARLRQVAGEVARVLRPGGVLVVNHCAQEQLGEAYWYYCLAPRARARTMRNFAPLETLRAILEAAGLRHGGLFAPLDAVCQGPAYFDGRGPLDQAWRDGDSFWSLVEPAELEAALARVRALDAAGALEAFVAEHDARRRAIGQITFLCATRG